MNSFIYFLLQLPVLVFSILAIIIGMTVLAWDIKLLLKSISHGRIVTGPICFVLGLAFAALFIIFGLIVIIGGYT